MRFGIGHVFFAKVTFDNPISNLTFTQRLINIPMVVFYYLKTFFFPLKLAIDQKWVITNIALSTFYIPLLIDMLFFVLLILLGIYTFRSNRKTFPIFLFFSLWFLSGLTMHSQLFSLDMTVADRYFYFPMVGLLGVLGIGVQEAIFPNRKLTKIAVVCIIVLLLVFSVRTIIRNANWYNGMTLFAHDSRVEDNFEIENDLGIEYLYINKYNDALKHLTLSVSQRSNELDLQNIGIVYTRLGDIQNAKKYYELALHADDYGAYLPHKHAMLTYRNYAPILVYYDNPNKANDFLEEAVKDYPDSPGSSNLWEFLALTKLKLHDKQAALDAIKKAYQLDPTNQEIVFVYSHILANQSFIMNIDGKKYKFN